MVEVLARKAELRRISILEARDCLLAWFCERAEPQARKGMLYTSPGADADEIRRVLAERGRTFFQRLASPYAEPTWADLRRVKARMQAYLLPPRRLAARVARELELWDYLLDGHGRDRASA